MATGTATNLYLENLLHLQLHIENLEQGSKLATSLIDHWQQLNATNNRISYSLIQNNSLHILLGGNKTVIEEIIKKKFTEWQIDEESYWISGLQPSSDIINMFFPNANWINDSHVIIYDNSYQLYHHNQMMHCQIIHMQQELQRINHLNQQQNHQLNQQKDGQISALHAENLNLKTQFGELESQISESRKNETIIMGENAKLKNDLLRKEISIQELETSNRDLHDSNSRLSQQLIKREEELKESKIKIQEIGDDNDSLNEDLALTFERNEQLMKENKQSKIEHKKLQRRLKKIEKDITVFNEEHSEQKHLDLISKTAKPYQEIESEMKSLLAGIGYDKGPALERLRRLIKTCVDAVGLIETCADCIDEVDLTQSLNHVPKTDKMRDNVFIERIKGMANVIVELLNHHWYATHMIQWLDKYRINSSQINQVLQVNSKEELEEKIEEKFNDAEPILILRKSHLNSKNKITKNDLLQKISSYLPKTHNFEKIKQKYKDVLDQMAMKDSIIKNLSEQIREQADLLSGMEPKLLNIGYNKGSIAQRIGKALDDYIFCQTTLTSYGHVNGNLKDKIDRFSKQYTVYYEKIMHIYEFIKTEQIRIDTVTIFNFESSNLFAKINALLFTIKILIDHHWYNKLIMEIMDKCNVPMDLICTKIGQSKDKKHILRSTLLEYFQDWNNIFYLRDRECDDIRKKYPKADDFTIMQKGVLTKLQTAKEAADMFKQNGMNLYLKKRNQSAVSAATTAFAPEISKINNFDSKLNKTDNLKKSATDVCPQ
jgi:hypothetical protein